MEVLINELSLNGQFVDYNDFRPSLVETLKVFKVLKKGNLIFLKKYDFYNSMFSQNSSLDDVLRNNDDAIVKFKSLLSEVISGKPYWEEDQMHESNANYICELTDLTCGYSLAEAFERDRLSISFQKSVFSLFTIKLKKDTGSEVDISNFFDYKLTLGWLFKKNLIPPIEYCLEYFAGTNLNFSKLEDEFGFNHIESSQVNQFIESFKLFSGMNWDDIVRSDGLKYKKYSPNSNNVNAFRAQKYSAYNICKFRIDQRMRCFGYRDGNIFYALRFEKDHSVSDNG